MEMSTKAIERFLKTAYTDEQLTMLLAHSEDGKMSFYSCCCLRGVPTADHALRGSFVREERVTSPGDHPAYWDTATTLHHDAEREFYDLSSMKPSNEDQYDLSDAERRTKLIPLIKAEMARRDALRTQENCNTKDHAHSPEEVFA